MFRKLSDCTQATGVPYGFPNTHRTAGGNCSKYCTPCGQAGHRQKRGPCLFRGCGKCNAKKLSPQDGLSHALLAHDAEQTTLRHGHSCGDADASSSSPKPASRSCYILNAMLTMAGCRALRTASSQVVSPLSRNAAFEDRRCLETPLCARYAPRRSRQRHAAAFCTPSLSRRKLLA